MEEPAVPAPEPKCEDYIPGNILLTGGAGFIGSHVVDWLVERYPTSMVICLDILDYCANMQNLKAVSEKANFKLVEGSICDLQFVLYLLKEHNIDTVLHFAAQSHVDRSVGNSIAFLQTNVVGTGVLMEACRVHGKCRRIIHVSTDEVYGEVPVGAASEATILAPTNPYAASKAGAECVCLAYIKSHHLPIIITRGNNVIGPRQFPEKVVPRFVYLLKYGRKLTLHGSAKQTRNFIHTKDVVSAFDVLLRRGKLHEIYNIGTSVETSVFELGERICKLMGKEPIAEFMEYVEDRPFNDCRYFVDSQRLRSLGWAPETDENFDGVLKETVDWFIAHEEWFGGPPAVQYVLDRGTADARFERKLDFLA